MAARLESWVDQLDSNLAHGKVAIFNPIQVGSRHLAHRAAADLDGMKRRAARWAIGWRLKGKSIKNYQAVVPTTWNAGPARCGGPARRL